MSFFNRADGGLSGPPLLRLGLASVRAVRLAFRALGLTDHVIVGVGGIHEPVHVMDYLDAGATATQAASIFFEDTLFGAKVMGALTRRGSTEPRGPQELLVAAEENALRAVLQVRRERPEVPAQRIQQIGMEIFLKHERQLKQAMAQGPWRQLRPPSVFEITKELVGRLGPRR